MRFCTLRGGSYAGQVYDSPSESLKKVDNSCYRFTMSSSCHTVRVAFCFYMTETVVHRRSERKKWVAPVAAVGLAVLAGLSGIAGWFIGDGGKLSEAEALGTANVICDATQAAMQQEINDLLGQVGGWETSSNNWGKTAVAAFAQLTQVASGTQAISAPVEVTRRVDVTREVTVEVTPTGLKCYVPATAAARTPTETNTATATRTKEPTLAQRSTDVATAINTRPVPTNTTVFVPTDTQAPTEYPTATNTQVVPSPTRVATQPEPSSTVPSPTNTDTPPTRVATQPAPANP